MTEQTIFLSALDISDPAARSAYLDQACAGNAALRAQVEALLAAHQRSGLFLDEPALEQAAGRPSRPNARTVSADEPAGPDTPTRTGPGSAAGPDDDLGFLKPPARPDSLGRLDRYDVFEVLGRGGFGTVLRAFDDRLHRVVAIKVLAPQLATSGPARQRFHREARAGAAVRDEHVVNIHEVSEPDEPLPYLVMEYVAGQTLQQKLDRTGPLSVPEILRIGSQVARGLAAAHATGHIHRDIKPSNILLENGVERVKLTDFGLARAVDDASISHSGLVAGTPMYMAPEQAKGERIDHRADLFSLGSVLYAMCTGRPPFRATTTMAVLKRVCEEDPRPVREVNPEVPEWLAAVIAKLHAKKPDDRFRSAKEVAEVLQQHLAHLQEPDLVARPPAVVPPPPSPPRRWQAGDRVLAPWEPEWLYAATVQQTNADSVLVAYDDGDSNWVNAPEVRPLDIEAGARVFGWWNGPYYPGTVTARDGDRVHIAYDDGDSEWTELDSVRVAATRPAPVERAPVAAPRPAGVRWGLVVALGLGLLFVLNGFISMLEGGLRRAETWVSLAAGAVLLGVGASQFWPARPGPGQHRTAPPRRRLRWTVAAAVPLVLLALSAAWFGRPALLYLSDRGELELEPENGLTSLIVLQNSEGVRDENKLHPMVTDWLSMKTSHTLKVAPGKYQLNAGTWPEGIRIIHWKVTTSGPFGTSTLLVPGEGLHGWSAIVTVERGCRTSVRPMVIKTLPPKEPSPGSPEVPRTAADVLPSLVGTWKIERLSRDPKSPPDEAPFVGYVDYHFVAGGKFLRGRSSVWTGGDNFLDVLSFDPANNAVRRWATWSDGRTYGPVSGQFNPANRTLVMSLRIGDLDSIHQYEFLDANAYYHQFFLKDASGTIIREVRHKGTRVGGPVALPSLPLDPKRPDEMKVLDRLVGEWRNEQTVTSAAAPGKETVETLRVKAEAILGGRFIEMTETNEATGWSHYTLVWLDSAAKQYREWYFNGRGYVLEFTGTWNEATKTLTWNSPDKRMEGHWVFQGNDRRAFRQLAKAADGKILNETAGVSRRTGSSPAPADRVVQALRDAVAAKERSLEAAKARYEAGADSRLDLTVAQIELTEARILLAEAERDLAAVRARLQELVTLRQTERDFTEQLVQAGRSAPTVLSEADARLAAAKARLAQTGAALPAGPQPVKLRSFTPGKDPLPLPHRGPASAVTAVGDAWRIENATNAGNFNVMVAQAIDNLPKDGVLVFRAKVKVEVKVRDEALWGDLGFGSAGEVFPSWDQWPEVRARYADYVTDWTEKEVRYPVAEVLKKGPTVYLYAGLHANGVLWLKDVELQYMPTAPAGKE